LPDTINNQANGPVKLSFPAEAASNSLANAADSPEAPCDSLKVLREVAQPMGEI
jgi:hypothetical protein